MPASSRDIAGLLEALSALARPGEEEKVARFYKGGDPETRVMGVPIGSIFPVAKRFAGMDLTDVSALLDDARYEVRMAAMAILDFKARDRKTDPGERAALFELYLRRHDRIDNWDLVDRAAPHVVGGFLIDGDRSALDELARSDDPWQRRTAIVATWAFIRRGEIDDTFRIAGLLARDPHPYVQKAVASWLREAGKRDPARLTAFLSDHREVLPRAILREAGSKLPAEEKARALGG